MTEAEPSSDEPQDQEQPPTDLGERAVARTHPEGEHHNTIDLARVFSFSR